MINLYILGEELKLKIYLNFEKNFNKPKIIRLEQNYRSTKNILRMCFIANKKKSRKVWKKLYGVTMKKGRKNFS